MSIEAPYVSTNVSAMYSQWVPMFVGDMYADNYSKISSFYNKRVGKIDKFELITEIKRKIVVYVD